MEVFASMPQFKVKGRTLLRLRADKGSEEPPQKAVADAELAVRLQQKDEHAFLSLYDLHRSAVFRFLMHMTGSTTVAEELVQEVFIVILDAMCAGTIRQFDPERGTWEGYLLGIARNLARTEQRRAHRVVSLDGILETPEWGLLLQRSSEVAQAGDIQSSLETRSELKTLYRAILELPGHYREALVLCGLQEKSYREAAVILQCSEGTVASRMNRAKGILAATLSRSPQSKTDQAGILRGKEGTDAGRAVKANAD
jgi:RNA polymerase sigma-70 factor, ECF subfamily